MDLKVSTHNEIIANKQAQSSPSTFSPFHVGPGQEVSMHIMSHLKPIKTRIHKWNTNKGMCKETVVIKKNMSNLFLKEL